MKMNTWDKGPTADGEGTVFYSEGVEVIVTVSATRIIGPALRKRQDTATSTVEDALNGMRENDAKLDAAREAIGLFSTLNPSMEMNANDPLRMAQETVSNQNTAVGLLKDASHYDDLTPHPVKELIRRALALLTK